MITIDADALIEKCGDWYVEEGTESGFIGTLKNLLATCRPFKPDATDTNVGDTISRQEAIDALDCINGTEEVLRSLPSAQPNLQTTCNQLATDLISRQALCEYALNQKDKSVTPNDIMRFPSAQPEPQWIPVERRFPEDYTDVLVWFEYFRYGDYNCLYRTHGIGTYVAEYNSWMINHESGWKDLRVIAWIPLPKPYEGEGEQE